VAGHRASHRRDHLRQTDANGERRVIRAMSSKVRLVHHALVDPGDPVAAELHIGESVRLAGWAAVKQADPLVVVGIELGGREQNRAAGWRRVNQRG
jgi:hypothetical protein